MCQHCDRFKQEQECGFVKSPAEVCLMQLDASVDAAHFRCNPNPPICLILLEAVTYRSTTVVVASSHDRLVFGMETQTRLCEH